MRRSLTRRARGTALTCVFCLETVAVLSGCDRKTEKKEQPVAVAGAAEGATEGARAGGVAGTPQALEEVLERWKERWLTGTLLPDCRDLFLAAEDGRVCTDASESLKLVQQAVQGGQEHAVLMKRTADLLITTERAMEKIHALRAGGQAGPQPFTQPAADARRAGARGTPEPKAGDSRGQQPELPESNPKIELGQRPEHVAESQPAALLARHYARVNRLALRYLTVFLKSGPPPVRVAALGEFERLLQAKHDWRAVQRAIADAASHEPDAELKSKMVALTPPTPVKAKEGLPH